MKDKVLNAIFGLSVIVSAVPASAQKTLPSISILIESPTAEMIACGVTEEGLTNAVRAAMRYNRITYQEDAAPFIYVAVAGGSLGGGRCVVAASLKFVEFQDISFGHLRSYSAASPCFRSGVYAEQNVSSTIYQQVKTWTDECTTDVLDKSN